METRKVQLAGGSTYTVSLPKWWVREAEIEAGDIVFMDPVEQGLIVRPEGSEARPSKRKVITLEKAEPKEHVLRKLIGAYVNGYRHVELHFPQGDASRARSVARDFTRMVIGAEIVEETGGRVLIQDLADPTELSAEKCLRRMYMTASFMVEDALEALPTLDAERAADIPPRDQDIDRLYWMVAKQYHLAASGPGRGGPIGGPALAHHYYLVAKLLERIGDHAEKIAAAILELKGGKLSKAIRKELEAGTRDAMDLLAQAFTALMAVDLDAANAAVDARRPLEKRVESIYRALRGVEVDQLLPLATIADSISRIGGYSTDVAEVAINHAVGLEEP